MRKILFSLIMIAATVGIVTSSAYALFSDTSNVQGVSISSGNAALKINGNHDVTANWFTEKVYPGWIGGQRLSLGNVSTSNINLDLVAKLQDVSGDWDSLKDKTLVAIVEYASSTDADAALIAKNPGLNAVANTGWVSFSAWYRNNKSIGTNLKNNTTHEFVFWASIDTSAGTEITGKSVNSNWVITGTQS